MTLPEYNREVIEWGAHDRMSSLEALQQRLELFREAGRNLQLDPLITRQDLDRLGVEYQVKID